jgi:hypothetical protein
MRALLAFGREKLHIMMQSALLAGTQPAPGGREPGQQGKQLKAPRAPP